MKKVTVYSKTHCPYCIQAKSLLNSRGIEYEEVNIEENQEARMFVLEQGHRTVPQLYIDGSLLVEGGFSGLAKLSENELKERIGGVNATAE